MANLSKIKRDNMIAFLEELKKEHSDDASIRAFNEIENHLRDKKYGLVWEEHSEAVDELLEENIPVLTADPDRRLCKDETLPWNFIIEGDNLQALYLLGKTHRGKVDCIYIDPPYNTGATDWKYNNDYVGKEDEYRHSKWLSMMKNRLLLAKHLLNPNDSVLIITIDEKEYLRLGCLLEELFPDAKIQMITDVVNPKGVSRGNLFSRAEEYIYFVFIGDASINVGTDNMLHLQENKSSDIRWASLQRSGSNSRRFERPNLFYPMYFDETSGDFVSVGESLPLEQDRREIQVPKGQVAVFPLGRTNDERTWQLSQETFLSLLSKGYVKFGNWQSKDKRSISYLSSGIIKQIESGEIAVVAYDNRGTAILEGESKSKPLSVWNKSSHSASDQGSSMINDILSGKRFTFPKSLYAVYDTLKFFVAEKQNAIVVDFFAGSGTTFHAVNLLNAQDNGHRRCIMVTNNEVSLKEAHELSEKGFQKGDDEWEALGIAQYVTWPRTVCCIDGVDVNNKPLKGDYGVTVENYEEDEDSILISKTTGKATKRTVYKKTKTQLYPELEKIMKEAGFQANVKYFKCDWTPRKPEDYLLSNVLCLHIREMIELQNAIEIDNVKNVLILNKSDFKNIILNPDIYAQIEHIWANQNIILNAEELKLLEAKDFKYIPREFFGHELKEAAE